MRLKKHVILVLLFVSAMLPVYADFIQLGGKISYAPDFTETGSHTFDDFSFSSFRFAPEVKLNLFFLTADASLDMGFSDGSTLFNVNTSAGLTFRILSLVRLSMNVGLSMPFVLDADSWMIGGLPVSDADILSSSSLFYKAGAGITLSSFEMMLSLSVPSEGTIGERSFLPVFSRSAISLSLLWSLI